MAWSKKPLGEFAAGNSVFLVEAKGEIAKMRIDLLVDLPHALGGRVGQGE